MKVAVAGGTGVVGKFVVDALRNADAQVTVLARSTGVDLTAADGLAAALAGVDTVVDVTSVQTQSGKESVDFFGTVTRHLQDAERSAGVRHHVVLSIVGSEIAPYGYYAGKAHQERLVGEGATPWTILRATQFHEFAQQIYGRVAVGPLHLVPTMTSQPVAAREVGERLARIALGEAQGRTRDLAGPQVLRMSDMVKRYATASGRGGMILTVPLPGGFGRAMRDGTLLPKGPADRGSETFDTWLSTVREAVNGRQP